MDLSDLSVNTAPNNAPNNAQKKDEQGGKGGSREGPYVDGVVAGEFDDGGLSLIEVYLSMQLDTHPVNLTRSIQ